ncbi:MAG: glucose-1-phosphate adenylyltransferase [Dehalococcoidia bacterium]
MKRLIALILAGGQGDRLSVLSEERAKPAVMFGGRYRIIDFALSNCANSGITRVGVLTQYRPRSLNDHIGIGRPWDLDRAGGGVSILQPYLGREISDWYSGTADAVYQNLYFIEESNAEHVLILAGDHVYKMAYDELLAFHLARGADVTIPVYGVPWDDASRFGTLLVDDDDRIVDFDEKPAVPRSNLVSMGIYLFNKDVLVQSLISDANRGGSGHDFGGNVIPPLVADGGHKVFGYRYQGYWRDVGTIESYFEANMELLGDLPELDMYEPEMRVRSGITGYPPAKIGRHAEISRALIDLGCIINGHVEHSVISPGVFIEEGAIVRDSIIFDDTHIEAGAVVERSIIDKEVRVGARCRVGYGDDWTANRERPDIVNSGATIVGKRAEVPPDLRIGRNCVIGPRVVVSVPEDNYLPSGSTLRAPQLMAPFSV